MFSFKKFSYFLVIPLLLGGTVRAEYLLFEQRDGAIIPVGPETPGADAAFLTIMKYQFPANTNPANGITAEERAALDDNEQAFIQKKVQEVNPNFAIMFIPSVLYELYCIQEFLRKPAPTWFRTLVQLIRTNDLNETFDGPTIFERFKEVLSQASAQDVLPKDAAHEAAEEHATLHRAQILERAQQLLTRPIPEKYKRGSYPCPLEYVIHLFEPWLENILSVTLQHSNIVDPRKDDWYQHYFTGKDFPQRPNRLFMPRSFDSHFEPMALKWTPEDFYAEIAKSAHYGLFVYQVINQKLVNYLQEIECWIISEYNGNHELSVISADNFRKILSHQLADMFGNPKKSASLKYIWTQLEQTKDLGLSHYMLRDCFGKRTPVETYFASACSIMKKYNGVGRIIKDSVTIEYLAHHTQKIALYRGNNVLKSGPHDYPCIATPTKPTTMKDGSRITPTLSFGVSLFSGIFSDVGSAYELNVIGANAFEYVAKGIVGYTLLVSKAEYARDLREFAHILFIPPYPSIVSLVWGQGSMFHPQTIANATPEIHDSTHTAYNELFCILLPEHIYLTKFIQLFGSNVKFLKSRAPSLWSESEYGERLYKSPDTHKTLGNHDPELEEDLLAVQRNFSTITEGQIPRLLKRVINRDGGDWLDVYFRASNLSL